MGLVTLTPVNPNDEITAASVNSQPAAIAAVVNGQIDDTNISSVSGSKIANGTVTPAKTSFMTKTTDANGWTVYDYGNWKEYRKRFTFNQSIGGLAVLTVAPANGTGGTNLPTGLSTIGTNFTDYAYTVASGAGSLVLVLEGTTSATAINFTVSTSDGVVRSLSGFIDVTMVTP